MLWCCDADYFIKSLSTANQLNLTLSVALLDHEGEHVGENGRADPGNEDPVLAGHEEDLAKDDDGLEDGEDEREEEVLPVGAQQAEDAVGAHQRRADGTVPKTLLADVVADDADDRPAEEDDHQHQDDDEEDEEDEADDGEGVHGEAKWWWWIGYDGKKSKVEKYMRVWIDDEQDDSKNENKIESKWIRSEKKKNRDSSVCTERLKRQEEKRRGGRE